MRQELLSKRVCALVIAIGALGATFATALHPVSAHANENRFIATLAGVGTEHEIGSVDSIAADPNTGEIYLAGGNRIMKLTVDGNRKPVTKIVAGTGAEGFNGDGPAGETNVSPGEMSLCFHPVSGELYFVDTYRNSLIRRVTVDGEGNPIVETVAGRVDDEVEGHFHDGPATSVDLGPRLSYLLFHTIAGKTDLFFSDRSDIRRLTQNENGDRVIKTAVERNFRVSDGGLFAFRPNSSELVFTAGDSYIGRVNVEEDKVQIERLAGSGVNGDFDGDGPALDKTLNPGHVFFTPRSNSMYFLDYGPNDWAHLLRRLTRDRDGNAVIETVARSGATSVRDTELPDDFYDEKGALKFIVVHPQTGQIYVEHWWANNEDDNDEYEDANKWNDVISKLSIADNGDASLEPLAGFDTAHLSAADGPADRATLRGLGAWLIHPHTGDLFFIQSNPEEGAGKKLRVMFTLPEASKGGTPGSLGDALCQGRYEGSSGPAHKKQLAAALFMEPWLAKHKRYYLEERRKAEQLRLDEDEAFDGLEDSYGEPDLSRLKRGRKEAGLKADQSTRETKRENSSDAEDEL